MTILSRTPSSYWLTFAPDTDYPALREDITVDVAIVGGGMAGISSAYLLKQDGLRIAVLEAGRILQGTTGHTTAKITSQHNIIYSKIKSQFGDNMAKEYAVANESAIRFIENTVHDQQIDCDFAAQPAYIFTQRDEYIEKISDETKAASTLGIKAAYTENPPLPFAVKAAVRFDNQAQFHPRKYLLALAQQLTDAGIAIYEQSRIVDIEKGSPHILTSQDGKKVRAKIVIIASHYPFYNKEGLYFSRIYSERSYVAAVRIKGNYPGGMYISAESPTRSLRSQNTPDGELILVGGENHKTGQDKDTLKRYDALFNYAWDNFEVENIPYHWSTQDCMTMDSLPYAGLYSSKTPDLYLTTGYQKWGMTNSTASAIIIRDLIVKGESPWQDVYNPSRHSITASAKSFITENINVAGAFIGGKLNTPAASINTTCTHMGCELSWNTAEKSWDCPCHGSRFGANGDILEGPAVSPLKGQPV